MNEFENEFDYNNNNEIFKQLEFEAAQDKSKKKKLKKKKLKEKMSPSKRPKQKKFAEDEENNDN